MEDSLKMLDVFREYVDLVDASVGVRIAMDPAQYEDGWRRFVAREVKEKFGIPSAVMGNIRLPSVAEDIIASGDADFVVIGRGLLADPLGSGMPDLNWPGPDSPQSLRLPLPDSAQPYR